MLDLSLPLSATPGERPLAALLSAQDGAEPGAPGEAMPSFQTLLSAQGRHPTAIHRIDITPFSSANSARLEVAAPAVAPAREAELVPVAFAGADWPSQTSKFPATGTLPATPGNNLPPPVAGRTGEAPVAAGDGDAPLAEPEKRSDVAESAGEMPAVLAVPGLVLAALATPVSRTIADPAGTAALAAPASRRDAASPQLPVAPRPEGRSDQPVAESGDTRFAAGELASSAATTGGRFVAEPIITALRTDAAIPAAAMPNTPQFATQPAGVSAADRPAADAVRQTDLANLVEAIARARAEARPEAVSITVRHAEFGPVSLRFEHHRGELTVAMASPDPDFARAVTAATSADGGAASDDAARGGGGRQDGAAGEQLLRQGVDDQPGHSRPAHDRREPSIVRGRPGPSSDATPPSGEEPGADRGIFA